MAPILLQWVLLKTHFFGEPSSNLIWPQALLRPELQDMVFEKWHHNPPKKWRKWKAIFVTRDFYLLACAVGMKRVPDRGHSFPTFYSMRNKFTENNKFSTGQWQIPKHITHGRGCKIIHGWHWWEGQSFYPAGRRHPDPQRSQERFSGKPDV